MRALGFVVSLIVPFLGLLGYMAFDYTLANRMNRNMGGEGISFVTYVSGWVGIAGAFAKEGDAEPGAPAEPMPQTLIAMLPQAPDGWTARPTVEDDIIPFLSDDLGKKARALILDAATENSGRGVDQARQTYENGPRRVVFEVVRYPNLIFTSFMAMANKMELQFKTMEIDSRPFMTVRGLEVYEADLPDTAGARVFVADVGAQIHLRVTAPRRMTDEDLLAFFVTLHVPAMNADVVEPVPGLGEVPVIVLASVIGEETARARAEERAREETRRAEERAAREAEQEAAYEAERKAAEEEAAGISTDADSGVKVRKGTGEGSGKTLGGADALGSENCRTEGGRKICGSLDAPVPEE